MGLPTGFTIRLPRISAPPLLAHELLHLCDGQKRLSEYVMVAGSMGGLTDSVFIGILTDGAAFDYLVAMPLFAVVEHSVLSIRFDFISPTGRVIQLAEDFLDFCIREQRRLCKLIPRQRQFFF